MGNVSDKMSSDESGDATEEKPNDGQARRDTTRPVGKVKNDTSFTNAAMQHNISVRFIV
jgi:hypothetical protein